MREHILVFKVSPCDSCKSITPSRLLKGNSLSLFRFVLIICSKLYQIFLAINETRSESQSRLGVGSSSSGCALKLYDVYLQQKDGKLFSEKVVLDACSLQAVDWINLKFKNSNLGVRYWQRSASWDPLKSQKLSRLLSASRIDFQKWILVVYAILGLINC